MIIFTLEGVFFNRVVITDRTLLSRRRRRGSDYTPRTGRRSRRPERTMFSIVEDMEVSPDCRSRFRVVLQVIKGGDNRK